MSIEEVAKEKYPFATTPPYDAETSGWYNAAQAKLQKAFIEGAKWNEERILPMTEHICKTCQKVHSEAFQEDLFGRGRNSMKEQMMSEAIEGEVDFEYFGYKVIKPDLKQLDTLLESMNHGDKVKIIIIKED